MKPLHHLIVTVTVLWTCSTVTGQNLQFTVESTRLPAPVIGSAAVYDDLDAIYIFGGEYGQDRVWRYAISTGQLTDVGHCPPFTHGAAFMPRGGSGDVWYFAGEHTGGWSPNIYRFSTTTTSRSTCRLIGSMPEGVTHVGAAWDDANQAVYLIGGYHAALTSAQIAANYSYPDDSIYRFDGSKRRPDPIATFPTRQLNNPGMVWVPNAARAGAPRAYAFGGFGLNISSVSIYEYDPSSNTASRLASQLPEPVYHGCTAVLGRDVFVTSEHGLLKFDTVSQQVSRVTVANYPMFLSQPGCAFVPALNRMYMFGGFMSRSNRFGYTMSDEIYYVDLPPTATG